ncbi:MAG: single-stranded DNA-binding protein [Acidimicrobiales bacterium]|nr:single-stranded DNA-binding protein [Acidimicrobiales bacterium]
MAIPTELSLQGFIATAPEISVGPKGRTRFYCRVGIKQRRKEVDGSFTKLDPVYCDLVLFGHAAERAYPGFRPGDRFVASGYIHEYEQDRSDGPARVREQFVATHIGHDCASSRYVVDRTPARQPDPPRTQVSAGTEPTRVVGI